MAKKLLVLLLLTGFIGVAQTKISSTVVDSENQPIPFVNISNSSTKKGTVSNEKGQFTIEIQDKNDIIVFSFLGFEPKKIEANQIANSVILNETATSIPELVLTALNVKRESKELGYALQTINEKEIAEVKAVNFLDNISGKIAGVTITQGATGVGSTSKITIRGEQSFTNNNPLFIVDGTPINNNTVINYSKEGTAGFQEVDFGNGAMEVNPDDVASVTVLKGPSAAALYGTRASNGVIIITTKTGSVKNKGMGISYNSSLFVDTAFKLPEFQNEYGQGNNGQFAYVDGLGGGNFDNISYSWGPRLDIGNMVPQFDSPVQLADGTFVRGGDNALYSGNTITPTPFNSHPKNLKDFYRTGTTTINNLSIAQGFDKGNFRASYTDLRSESIIPGTNLNRQTLSANLNFKPSSKVSFTTNFNYVNSKSDNRPAIGYGSENTNYTLSAWGPRSLDINSLRNYWQPGLENTQQYSFNYFYFDNPFFTLLENRNGFNRDRVFGNLSLKYELAENLTFLLRSGMDYSNEKRTFLRNFSSNRFKEGGYAEHNVFYREVNTDFLLNYTKKINNFNFDISVGGNKFNQTAETNQIQTTRLAQPGIFSFNNAAYPLQSFNFVSNKKINSFYGVAKLGFKDFLYLDITGRNDWSSALATPFASDNTSFFYPSASTSFVFTNAFKLPEVVSFGKLRLSVAQVGNDTNAYQTSSAFVTSTTVNSLPAFSNQNFIPNANLVPEATTAFEIGTDIRFFKERFNLDFTYYNSLTEDQIISLPVAISSGYNQKVINGGAVRSKGVEIIANFVPIKTANFKWDATFNFSKNVSIVEALPQEGGRITLAYSRIYDNPDQTVWLQVEKGGRVGDLYGTGYLKNENGDFVLNASGRYIADPNLKKLGNYNPDFILGFNNNFSYKNWNLGMLFDWHQGGILVSRTLALAGVAGQLKETGYRPDGGFVVDGVQNIGSTSNPIYQQNTVAISPEQYYRDFYDRNHEENNVYDASYLKFRQFSLGYSFTIKNGLFQSANAGTKLSFSIIGRNLFAFSAIPHFDPEQIATQGQNVVSGVENMSYASTRSIGMKVGVEF